MSALIKIQATCTYKLYALYTAVIVIVGDSLLAAHIVSSDLKK